MNTAMDQTTGEMEQMINQTLKNERPEHEVIAEALERGIISLSELTAEQEKIIIPLLEAETRAQVERQKNFEVISSNIEFDIAVANAISNHAIDLTFLSDEQKEHILPISKFLEAKSKAIEEAKAKIFEMKHPYPGLTKAMESGIIDLSCLTPRQAEILLPVIQQGISLEASLVKNKVDFSNMSKEEQAILLPIIQYKTEKDFCPGLTNAIYCGDIELDCLTPRQVDILMPIVREEMSLEASLVKNNVDLSNMSKEEQYILLPIIEYDIAKAKATMECTEEVESELPQAVAQAIARGAIDVSNMTKEERKVFISQMEYQIALVKLLSLNSNMLTRAQQAILKPKINKIVKQAEEQINMKSSSKVSYYRNNPDHLTSQSELIENAEKDSYFYANSQPRGGLLREKIRSELAGPSHKVNGELRIVCYDIYGEPVYCVAVKNLSKRFYDFLPNGLHNIKALRLVGEFKVNPKDVCIPIINFNIYRKVELVEKMENIIPLVQLDADLRDFYNNSEVTKKLNNFTISRCSLGIDISWVLEKEVTSFAGRVTNYPIYEDHSGKLECSFQAKTADKSLKELIMFLVPNQENLEETRQNILNLSYKAPKNPKYPPVIIHPINEEVYPCLNIKHCKVDELLGENRQFKML